MYHIRRGRFITLGDIGLSLFLNLLCELNTYNNLIIAIEGINISKNRAKKLVQK